MLSRLNKELDQQEAQPDATETADERLAISKGFRYLV
jgi:hypothetical protein